MRHRCRPPVGGSINTSCICFATSIATKMTPVEDSDVGLIGLPPARVSGSLHSRGEMTCVWLCFRIYYGSEFCRQIVDLWAYQHKVRIDFSRPGKPTENAYVESFRATWRRECLNAHCGSSHGTTPKSASRPGGRNTPRVGLTGRSRIARRRSSPGPTRRISSASPSSPLETLPSDGTKLGSRPLRSSLTFTLDQFGLGRSRARVSQGMD